MMRLLIVGEAPPRGRDGEPAFTPSDACGARLTRMLGAADVRSVAHTANLFDRHPAPWSPSVAVRSAADLLIAHPHLRVIVLGRRVAAAFNVAWCEWLTWHQISGGRLIGVMPYPGRGRWWKDPAHVAAAGRFLREAVDDRVWVPA